jgi:1,2-diacylglycerol 3-alpha-glucosyltransferase
VQRLRVGLFTEIYRPAVNGVVASVEALAAGLERRGHEVFCFAPQMPGAAGPEDAVVRIPSLPLPARPPYRLILPVVSRRARDAVVKRLSLVHAHSPFVTGWMGAHYARRYGKPLVYTYHTQLEAYAHYVPFEANATRMAASALTRTFANLAGAVIAPTPAMAGRLRELGVTVRIETVPTGIDLTFFGGGRRSEEVRARAGARGDDRLLLSVCRLAKEKNLELLFEALALAGDPSLKLAIAGEGPLRQELEQRARALGLHERTRFLGVVPRTDLPGLYASADAFVLPSVTETQGIVLAEALAAGALVMAPDTLQNRDVLADAGLLIPATAADFARAFAGVRAAADPARAAAARRVAGRFSIDAQIDRVLSLYDSLLRAAQIA